MYVCVVCVCVCVLCVCVCVVCVCVLCVCVYVLMRRVVCVTIELIITRGSLQVNPPFNTGQLLSCNVSLVANAVFKCVARSVCQDEASNGDLRFLYMFFGSLELTHSLTRSPICLFV
jgi:hypothetical protein